MSISTTSSGVLEAIAPEEAYEHIEPLDRAEIKEAPLAPESAPVLTNEDLRAIPESERRWGTWNYTALWIGMSVCIPTYMLASSLIDGGMNWWQAVLTVLLGNVIVLVPMVLNGHAGAKYGIPFPVFARASFGTRGANVPAMLRAIVACGWFGIQTWIGGAALAVVLEKLGIWQTGQTRFLDEILGFGGGALHVRAGVFACFLAFWLVNMAVVWAGIESIRKLLVVKSIFLPLATLGLLLWAYVAANGFGSILTRPSSFKTTGDFLAFFFPAVTGMVGFWATLSLNIPDFTRYAKSQRAQATGQALGLPTSMTAVAFVGVAVTSATTMLPAFGGKAEWDPVKVVGQFSSPALVAFAMLCVVVSTLATNIAANIVSPANDFSNLSPSRISFRTGGYVTGLVGILMFPWKLLEDPTGYIFTWLIGYSALLGPIGGILIVDYFLVRRRELSLGDLYRHEGRYGYFRGWNPVAIVALVLGILPNVPGFIMTVAPSTQASFPTPSHVPYLIGIYHYAWFVGFLVSGAVYWAGMRRSSAAPEPKLA
ncbi:NCS1 family nucleobase:cation symporter-1 [bacterium]|nr:NCS1 family nucleobase:cation symporter-1 [bacterium]